MSTTLRNAVTGAVIVPNPVVLKNKITGEVYPAISYYEWQLIKAFMDKKCKDNAWRHCPEHRAEFIALLEEAIKANK